MKPNIRELVLIALLFAAAPTAAFAADESAAEPPAAPVGVPYGPPPAPPTQPPLPAPVPPPPPGYTGVAPTANGDPSTPPTGNPPPPPTYAYPPANQPPPGYYAPPPPAYGYYRPRPRRYTWSDVDIDSTWLNFRVAEMGTFQTGAHQYSPYLSWSPRFTLHGANYYFGFNIGGSILTDATDSNLLALDYQFILGTTFGAAPIGFEFGLGGQSWINSNGDMFPAIRLGLFYRLDSVVDRVFVDYTSVLVGGFYTSQAKAGIEFSF